jgi:ABC-type protease/lipase transport system fused ATPase/permease subunit
LSIFNLKMTTKYKSQICKFWDLIWIFFLLGVVWLVPCCCLVWLLCLLGVVRCCLLVLLVFLERLVGQVVVPRSSSEERGRTDQEDQRMND